MKPEKKVYVKVFISAAVLVAVLSGFIALVVVGSIQRDRERTRSRYAFCIEIEKLKAHDRARGVADLHEGQKFLAEHPNGTPDFSRELILRSIARAQQQITDDTPNDCVSFSHNP